jgi:hypothetical protein
LTVRNWLRRSGRSQLVGSSIRSIRDAHSTTAIDWSDMRNALFLPILCMLATATIAAEPPGLRETIAKHDELRAERSRRLYGAHIPPVDPASYEFDFALADLNGDGIPDAIVLFKGPHNCGSGGCTLEILRGTKQGFEYISGSTISREPIQILAEKRFGWHSFAVSVSGSGAKPCNALMRFNGHKYPLNPSVAPCATPAQLQSAMPVSMTQ